MAREPFSYRTDPAVPAFPDDRAVIVFDGHCALCSGWARFVLRVLPLSWRDALYGVMARNRLKWFGRREACFLGETGWQDRFLA